MAHDSDQLAFYLRQFKFKVQHREEKRREERIMRYTGVIAFYGVILILGKFGVKMRAGECHDSYLRFVDITRRASLYFDCMLDRLALQKFLGLRVRPTALLGLS